MLLLVLTGYSKKDIIPFFYLFNLFESSFIILLGCDNIQYNDIIGFIEAKVKVNPKSI